MSIEYIENLTTCWTLFFLCENCSNLCTNSLPYGALKRQCRVTFKTLETNLNFASDNYNGRMGSLAPCSGFMNIIPSHLKQGMLVILWDTLHSRLPKSSTIYTETRIIWQLYGHFSTFSKTMCNSPNFLWSQMLWLFLSHKSLRAFHISSYDLDAHSDLIGTASLIVKRNLKNVKNRKMGASPEYIYMCLSCLWTFSKRDPNHCLNKPSVGGVERFWPLYVQKLLESSKYL